MTKNYSEIDARARLLDNTGTPYKIWEFGFAVDRQGKTHILRRMDYLSQTILEQLHLKEEDNPDVLVSTQFGINNVPKYWPTVIPDIGPSGNELRFVEFD